MYYNLSNKRVFLTGVAGSVGSALAKKFLGLGAEVHGVVRKTTNLESLSNTEITKFHNVNLLQIDDIESALEEIKPHIIINASVGRMPSFKTTGGERYLNEVSFNVTSVYNLLMASKSIDYEHFIQLGSSTEYGNLNKPRAESDIESPSTEFGLSKLAATKLCRQFYGLTGKPVTVLRLFTVYGPGEKKERLIPVAIESILKGHEIKLTEEGYSHDFVYIDDVVDGCFSVLGSNAAAGEIINICTGVKITNEEVIATLEGVLGKKAEVIIGGYDTHIYDSKDWVGDVSKAKDILGWGASFSLKDGLENYISRCWRGDD